MLTNKQKWEQRHREGKTKLDVAIETQLSADAAFIFNSVKKATSKTTRHKVNSFAEAEAEAAEKTEKTNESKKAEADKQAEIESEGNAALDAKAKSNSPKVSL